MKVMCVEAYGPVETLHAAEVPTPEPAAGQVRVRVHSSAVNPADYKTVTGETGLLHKKVFPLVCGYDFSGVIDAVGDGVDELSTGQAVFGHLHYGSKTVMGAFAEYLIATPDMMAPKPDDVEHDIAAASATPGLTALQSLRDIGGILPGARVLIVGASGGVGSTAIGIAKRLGANVTGICSTPAVELVRELGADEVLDRKKEDPLTLGGSYDIIFDAAAAYSYGKCSDLLKAGGAYITTLPSLSFVGGKLASLFSSKRCSFVIVSPKTADLAALGVWLSEGLKLPIDSSYPVRKVGDAMARQKRGGMKGRIVVDVLDGFAVS
jgi:NADPH:quinone reductase-like Zn-dependent oxidoreductase